MGQRSAVPTANPPRPNSSHHSPKPCHTSLKFLTRPPSTRSSYPHDLTLPQPCYSGPVRAPAFRERQTGAPRPGSKSSPWPPSVSRSTDRVTQNNGIDPKAFWRLRAIPKEPHPINPYPGPLAGRGRSIDSEKDRTKSPVARGPGSAIAETCGCWPCCHDKARSAARIIAQGEAKRNPG